MKKISLAAALSVLFLICSHCRAQTDIRATTFEAATIKPTALDKGRKAGFYGEPGGRIFFGGTVKSLIQTAFDL